MPSDDGGARVEIPDGEEGVAPGQACVFYEQDGSRVLGGGWIAAAPRRDAFSGAAKANAVAA